MFSYKVPKLLKNNLGFFKAGRNNTGKITAFHRGGRNKRLYRAVDFWRRLNLSGVVLKLVYDPNRTATIACVFYFNGLVSYIVATTMTVVGSKVFSGNNFSASKSIYLNESERKKDLALKKVFFSGNSLSMKDMPLGSVVNNFELHSSKGSQIARSAGLFALLYKKTELGAYLKLRSGWRMVVSLNNMATFGIVSNIQHYKFRLPKAGYVRAMGRRPVVRGVAMNPIDHPHGGGQGRTKPGVKPKTPWGKLTKWRKTIMKKQRLKKLKFRFKE